MFIDFELIHFDEFMLLPNVETIQTFVTFVMSDSPPTKSSIQSGKKNQRILSGWLQVLTLSMDIFFGLEVAFRVPGDTLGQMAEPEPHRTPFRFEKEDFFKRPKNGDVPCCTQFVVTDLERVLGTIMDQLILFVSCASKETISS